jgi:predicted DNA-binding protein with PD1-like motif
MENKYLVFRLKPDSDLYESIVTLCSENKLHTGSIISAVGCVKELTIRIADGKTIYHESCNFEVTALSGTISEEGLHLHIQVCDSNLRCLGGHLQVGTIVNTTMEIVIVNLESEYRLTRSFDEATGYNELEVQKK